MPVKVTLTDNSTQVLAKLSANKNAALQAMGVKAVGLTVDQMEKGYKIPHKNRPHGKKYMKVFTTNLISPSYRPSDGGTHTAIRDTGDLMRSIAYAAENSGKDKSTSK